MKCNCITSCCMAACKSCIHMSRPSCNHAAIANFECCMHKQRKQRISSELITATITHMIRSMVDYRSCNPTGHRCIERSITVLVSSLYFLQKAGQKSHRMPALLWRTSIIIFNVIKTRDRLKECGFPQSSVINVRYLHMFCARGASHALAVNLAAYNVWALHSHKSVIT